MLVVYWQHSLVVRSKVSRTGCLGLRGVIDATKGVGRVDTIFAVLGEVRVVAKGRAVFREGPPVRRLGLQQNVAATAAGALGQVIGQGIAFGVLHGRWDEVLSHECDPGPVGAAPIGGESQQIRG